MNFYRNKWLIYLIQFFHHLIPAYTIERLFWQERGMNIQMVVWCGIVYEATIMLLEFPSGVLADRFGRKRLVVIGAFFATLELVIIAFAHNFWLFAFAVFLAAINTAFTSGAHNALLYDSLASAGKTAEFEKTLGRLTAVDYTAGILAALSGGFMAAVFSMEVNYYVSVCSMLVALFVACMLKEPPLKTPAEQVLTVKHIVKTSVGFFKTHSSMIRICLNSAIVAALIVFSDEFWQLYLESFSFPVALFGVVSAVLSVVVVVTSFLSPIIIKRLGNEKSVVIFTLFCGVGLLFTAFTHNIFGMIGVGIAGGSAIIVDLSMLGHLHKYADDNARASIESAVSLGQRAVGIAAGLLFGYVSTASGVGAGYCFIGVAFVVTGVVFAKK